MLLHPLLAQLKQTPNLFPEKKKKEGLEAISHYSNVYNDPTSALNAVLKVIDKLYRLKQDGWVLSNKGYVDIDFNLAIFSVLKAIFYSMEKGYKDLSDLPEMTEDIIQNTVLLNQWSEENIEKILQFLQNSKV